MVRNPLKDTGNPGNPADCVAGRGLRRRFGYGGPPDNGPGNARRYHCCSNGRRNIRALNPQARHWRIRNSGIANGRRNIRALNCPARIADGAAGPTRRKN